MGPVLFLLTYVQYSLWATGSLGPASDDNTADKDHSSEEIMTDVGHTMSLRSRDENILVEEECGNLRDAFDALGEAYYGMEIQLKEKLSHISLMHERESNLSAQYRRDIADLQSLVEKQNESMASLRKRVHSLVTSIEYYKKKLLEVQSEERQVSLPLEEAVIQSVNALLSSKQRYKVMSVANISESMAKAIFNNNFANGMALNSIICHAKKWLRKNVFTPEQILKQMDLHGGTLNYEGISILNKIEAAPCTGNNTRYTNRLLCTSSCLKRVAKKLETAANELCPFHSYMTPFGEAIEFDYSKATRLVIDAFGLLQVGREREQLM